MYTMLSRSMANGLIACVLLLMGWIGPVHAQDAQGVEAVAGKEEADTLESAGASRKRSFVVLPMPSSDPALGSGLTLVGVMYYQPEGSSRPWTTGAGAMWTSNGSRGGGVYQKAYLGGDRYRMSFMAGSANINLRYYGIGDASSDASIPIEQHPTLYQADLLRKVADHHFLGLRLRQLKVDTRLRVTLPEDAEIELPTLDVDTRLAGPALLYEFDTRTTEQAPDAGSFGSVAVQWNLDAWGSRREYTRVSAYFNHFKRLREDGVLALRGSGCWAGSDAPFFELCKFGASNDLRGYESGRHRDKTLLAAQAEYRWQMTERWGAAFFGGVGGVAAGLGDYRIGDLLPSAGVGIRFKASTAYNVNVSLDYARGKDGDAVYVYIGESF